MVSSSNRIQQAFDPGEFRKHGHELIETLADYLEQSLSRKCQRVLPDIDPVSMLTRWPGEFQGSPKEDFSDMARRVLSDSNNLQHPRYIGHQCCTTLPITALTDLIGSFLNNGSAIYEMGPVNVAMEKRLIEWMAGLAGFDEKADGIFTHGGSAGNLTAILAARQLKAGHDVWRKGVNPRDGGRMVALVSEQSHYSIKRAFAIMGLGEESVVAVPVDGSYRMNIKAAEDCYQREVGEGRKVFIIVANACSTAAGSYDDLRAVGDFADKRGLWFHVDGAHGASALLSQKYRILLNGIDRADSVVWDAHKMLMVPALATAVLFRNGADSYASFSQSASYLFEKQASEERYNFAHRTLECTKSMIGLKLYVALQVHGTELFADFVTRSYDLARDFAVKIAKSPDFELPVFPESNILCFRFKRKGTQDIDALQRRIRRGILKSEKFYIVQTTLKESVYLRLTLINPNTTMEDLDALLDEIRSLALKPAQ